MTAAPARRAVDDLARALLAPLLHARPRPGGWRVVNWDAEQGLCVTLGRGAAVLLVEFEARDAGRACYARTARFNVCARRQFAAGAALDADDRRAVDALAALVRAREAMLPVAPDGTDTPVDGGGAVREIEVDRVLMPEGRGHYYLNPYVGCTIGCAYCYVAARADLSRALEGLPRLAWGRYVDVKVNAAAVLRREVAVHAPGVVRLSPIVTDPYQPVERRYRITRQCLEVLLAAGFAPVVLTRAALVARDLDVLARFPRAAVGFSIPTDDDAVRRRFEPRGDAIAARLAALARCHAAGVRTFVVVQPVLPMDVGRLVAAVAPVARAVRIDRMYDADRVGHLYAAAGHPAAAGEAFYARTAAALRAAFEARGVVVDDLDDLGGLVGA